MAPRHDFRSRGRSRSDHGSRASAVPRGSASLRLPSASAFGYASWALVCRGGRCPSVEVARRVHAAPDVEALRRRRPLHRRARARAPDARQARRDSADRAATRSSSPRTSASISTPASTGTACPARSLADIQRRALRRGLLDHHDAARAQHLPRADHRARRRFVRKLKEAKVARAIEAKYDKDKILELYLNQIYLGNGAYGVETAAQRYFGKSVRDLNLAEAATLAALPKAPERYNPRRFPERAIQRRNTVIELMREQRRDQRRRREPRRRRIRSSSRSKTEAGDIAPYFVEWVRQQLDAAVRQAALRAGTQGLHDARPRHADRRRARARASAPARSRRASTARTSTRRYEHYIARSRERRRGAVGQLAVSAGRVRRDGSAQRRRARDGRRPRFRRLASSIARRRRCVSPARRSSRSSTPTRSRTDARRRTSSTTRRSSVPHGRRAAEWTPQNYDGSSRGPMPMRRGLYRVAQHRRRFEVGMELGEQSVIDEARKFGITTPIPPYPSILHRRGRRLSDRDDLRLLGVRELGHRAPRRTRSCASRMRDRRVLWQPTPTRTPGAVARRSVDHGGHDEGRDPRFFGRQHLAARRSLLP